MTTHNLHHKTSLEAMFWCQIFNLQLFDVFCYIFFFASIEKVAWKIAAPRPLTKKKVGLLKKGGRPKFLVRPPKNKPGTHVSFVLLPRSKVFSNQNKGYLGSKKNTTNSSSQVH